MLSVLSCYLGGPIAGRSVVKAPCLPLKSASVMVLPSGAVDGGWEML